MRNRYIESFEQAQIEAKDIPDFRAGDTVRLGVEIKEGDKKRVQAYEGVVIAVRGQGTGRTFTVRKIGANSVGVERVFPVYSDSLKTIDVIRKGKVRRAKLNYLRGRRGKAAKIKELRKYRLTYLIPIKLWCKPKLFYCKGYRCKLLFSL